jgi:SpoVK/Ycf46/Vps4 family AAA+-type ATPase
MMQDQSWIDLCEISSSTSEALRKLDSQHEKNYALHLFVEGNPLASVVVEIAFDSNSSFDHQDSKILIHPVLFEFLYQAVNLIQLEQELKMNDNETNAVIVSLGPLPMESPFLKERNAMKRMQQEWKVSTIEIIDMKQKCHVSLSCIYIESDLFNKFTNTQFNTETFLKMAMHGRIVKLRSIFLISTPYGFAIFQTTDIQMEILQEASNKDSSTVAHRITSDDELEFYNELSLTLNIPEYIPVEPFAKPITTISYHDIPGYEKQLEEILGVLHLHQSAASPSAILIAGAPGVGKSRMASCIAHHHEQQGNTVCLLSMQELIFRALTETDLLQDYVLPLLSGCSLFVLDDLHLLELGDSDETQRDPEYMIVQNSITQLIDQYKDRCRIVGVAQNSSKLPPELTRITRLEKSYYVLPPTQMQRVKIWESLLTSNDGVLIDNVEMWSLALASTTAGCVADDIVRVYQSAWTRSWGKNKNVGSATLQWEDLCDAAHACIPSQLSELDVIKPRLRTDDGDSWSGFAAYHSVKKQLYRSVVIPWQRFLRHMDDPVKDEESWLEPPSGVLFHGPSGCGKTVSVECLAVSLGLPMIQVRAADVLDKWLGGSEALLRSLFARARAASPCILFLDEIDSIAINRAEGDTNNLSSRILSTLLNEMDGVSSSIKASRVLVVACTNRFDALDSALLRPGRLQEHLHLGIPTSEDLVEILKLRTKNIPLANDIDLVFVANELYARHATGADVEGLCREVCLIAFRRSDNPDEVVVTKHDMYRAITALTNHDVSIDSINL